MGGHAEPTPSTGVFTVALIAAILVPVIAIVWSVVAMTRLPSYRRRRWLTVLAFALFVLLMDILLFGHVR